MNTASKPSFIAQDITVCRGDKRLLSNVSFALKTQQLLRIIGANGSGKTSLLRIIAGLSEAESGSLTWLHPTQQATTSYTEKIAYIGHRDGLKNTLSTIENLRFYQQLQQTVDTTTNTTQIERLLHQLNLLDHADVVAGSLSFGQRRRLAFARLLLAPQPLWLLDEPFTGIDIDGRTLIESICEHHLQTNGMIIMTHHGNLDDSVLGSYETQLDLNNLPA